MHISYVSLLGMNRRVISTNKVYSRILILDNDGSVIPIFLWCAMLVVWHVCRKFDVISEVSSFTYSCEQTTVVEKNACTDTILGSSKIVFLAYPISIASSCVVVVLEKCTHGCFFFALGEREPRAEEDTRTQ